MSEFLRAKWQDIVMANYSINPLLVHDLIPRGTEIDLFKDKCFVSIVAFKFIETRVLGVPVPRHKDFEEINLRFYVKRNTADEIRRGVVFIKEIVSKPAITWVAQKVYGEPYETWNTFREEADNEIAYYWERDETENRLSVEHSNVSSAPSENSIEEFITQHHWRYTRRSEIRTDEYRVDHSNWDTSEINYAEIEIDFGTTFGERFGFLSNQTPDSIFFAIGSEITVHRGERLRRA